MHKIYSIIKRILTGFLFLLLFGHAMANDWNNPKATHYITPYDFFANGNIEKKKNLEKFIGRGFYNRLSDFYTDINDVYDDFNLAPDLVMSCQKRHRQYIGNPSWSTRLKKNAENYFCEGEFNTSFCHTEQKKKVYLDYCLDLNDTLDWVAIQSAFLNAEGREVVIPPDKEFHVNQSLVMPDGLSVLWSASKGARTKTPGETDGTHYERPGASFIKYVPQDEPINSDQPRKTGFSIGSMFTIARIEMGIDCKANSSTGGYGFAPYSGVSATLREPNRVMAKFLNKAIPGDITRPCEEGIVHNIRLRYPHIDVNNIVGENGLSFGLGAGGRLEGSGKFKVGPLKVYGGVIKNVKINVFQNPKLNEQGDPVLNEDGTKVTTSKGVVAYAGGKAIQCEAGCRGLDIRGISIINADIGINSNALSRVLDSEGNALVDYELLNLFGPGMTSQVQVLGLRTVNVGSPINIANTINTDASQEVTVNNFAFYNSGSGEWADTQYEDEKPDRNSEITMMCSNLDLETREIQSLTTEAHYLARDGGIVTSRNGIGINIEDGSITNDLDYLGVPALVNVIKMKDTANNSSEFLRNLPLTIKDVSSSTTKKTVR